MFVRLVDNSCLYRSDSFHLIYFAQSRALAHTKSWQIHIIQRKYEETDSVHRCKFETAILRVENWCFGIWKREKRTCFVNASLIFFKWEWAWTLSRYKMIMNYNHTWDAEYTCSHLVKKRPLAFDEGKKLVELNGKETWYLSRTVCTKQ